MYKPIFLYLFDFKVVLGPDIDNCRTIFYQWEDTSEITNFYYQNKVDSVSALCSKEMALEIYEKLSRKDTTGEFPYS